MIKPEKKNKAIIGYTTKTKRVWFHTQSKKFGFGSTSKMILQALEFLIKTLDNGISITNITSKTSKDPVWNSWEQKGDKAKVMEKIDNTPHGLVIKEMRGIFEKGYQFKKFNEKEIHTLSDEELIEKANNIMPIYVKMKRGVPS